MSRLIREVVCFPYSLLLLDLSEGNRETKILGHYVTTRSCEVLAKFRITYFSVSALPY